MRKKFLFDLDDTLMPNTHYYDFARIEFYKLLVDRTGMMNLLEKSYNAARIELFKWLSNKIGYRCPSLQTVLNLEFEAYAGLPEDKKEYSFNVTYKTIAEQLNLKITPNDLEQLHTLQRLMPNEANNRQIFLREVVNLDNEINVRNVKKMGFNAGRFPTSLKETYMQVIEALGLPPDEEGAIKAFNKGTLAFDFQSYKKKGLLSGAKDTLEFLASQGDELALLTKGDERIQALKIHANRLNRWFSPEQIHIVPDKDAYAILKHCQGWDLNQVYHVGNLIKSDVIPALDAGIKMIYIPCETWQYEREHKGLPESDRLITLDKISDIIQIYEKL